MTNANVAPDPTVHATTVGSFGKMIATSAYSTVLAVVVALTDGGEISWVEWITIIGTALISAVGIYATSNKNFKYAKLITGAITAAIGTLCTALFDGSFTAEELVAVIVAVGGALGLTGSISNAAYSDPHLQKR